jgi:hypothetical protein
MTGNNSYLEKYTWMSGLLVKSHYIWVVYSPKEPHLFQVHYLNREVDPELQPDYKVTLLSPSAQPQQPATIGSAVESGTAGDARTSGDAASAESTPD